MKKYSLPVITVSLLLLALLFCLIVTRPFADEQYTQSNLLKYYLLTPKPLMDAPRVASEWYFTSRTDEGSGLQISTLNFTHISPADIQRLSDELEGYVDSYPDRRATMGIAAEENKGMFELRVTHYASGDDR
ncbi:TPA: hypothetical protein QCG56_002681 [Enterobacter cancerogenus]|nr:hypothetical protein [Enterobacter asburiae]HDR2160743.1 hypothetical protein [Enterobacter cancerogenus]HDR2165654.1 hypothetical protein [Enterobacter cancerogenus]HDR2268404.1 hypothetical protein [Enterobacter cancerogenus]